MKSPEQLGRVVRFGTHTTPEEQARQDARQLLHRYLDGVDTNKDEVLHALVLLLKSTWDTRR